MAHDGTPKFVLLERCPWHLRGVFHGFSEEARTRGFIVICCCFFIRLADSDVLIVNLITGTGNVRFGSLADLHRNSSLMSAFGGTADVPPQEISLIRNEGDHANGSAGTTFNFHRQSENQCTDRWQLVQISQVFEIADVTSCSDAMHHEIR